MLPRGDHLTYQNAPNPSQYQFDLKVAVDFNSGKVNLGVPQNVHAFAKKPEIPVMYGSQGGPPILLQNQSYISTSNYPGVPSYQQLPVFQNGQNYVRNEQAYSSAYPSYPADHSEILRYGNMKTRSANETYPDTFSSFSYNLERSVDAVNCVICNKPVNREQFHAHLEEHKGRKKEYGRPDGRIANEPQSRMNSFQVRNQHSMAGVADIYREPPSRQSRQSRNSQSLPHRDLSRRNLNSISLSRQIEESQSRIVYAPRDPSRMLSPQHSQSAALNYSKSSGYQSLRSKPSQQRQMVQVKEPSLNQQSLSMQNLSLNQNYPSNYANPSISQNNRTNSYNVLPPEMTRRNETENINRGSQSGSRQNNLYQSAKKNLNIRESKVQGPPDYYNLNLTESQIMQPSRQKYSLEDCDQSMINHLTQISRFSKQSSIGELKKQLNIQRIQEEDSSDDEEMYYSLRPSSFQRRAYTSMHPADIKKRIEDSRYTNGLTRSKMPINNLAVEQFIQNPMYYSCFRSTHRM